ncbi:hypothetical protein HNP69_001762 [Chryseobacterium koreense]|nr:hypothetical protein [Chryseobacterium koreense]
MNANLENIIFWNLISTFMSNTLISPRIRKSFCRVIDFDENKFFYFYKRQEMLRRNTVSVDNLIVEGLPCSGI